MPLRRTRGRPQDYNLKKGPDQEDPDVDDDLDEEVTRCICGNEELNTDDPSIDTGFFIQCENCSVWQHGYCVGIKDTADSPEKYWCEQCKPELHALIENGTKSLYIPVNGEVKVEEDSPERVKETESNSQDPPEEGDLADANEATDNKDVKEVKKNKEPRSSRDGRESRESKENKETKDPKDAKEKLSIKQEEARSRLSFRESRQLQQALELSAKESGVKPETIETLERPRRTANSNGTEHTSDESEPTSNKRKNEAGTANKKGKETKSKRMKSASSSSSSSKESKKEDKKILQLNSEKPFKPKTHASKISLVEMRKRIAGILEFIGRTQIEMANEENERAQLTKHLKDDGDEEETALKLKIETNLITSSKNTLAMMDTLTRKLLRWEQQFDGPK